MVFWRPWRCWLVEDFSDLAAAADPEAFPLPLGAPVFAAFTALGSAGPDSPEPPAEESACPTAATALSLSLGRVWVEPME